MPRSPVALVGGVFSAGFRITDPKRLFGRRSELAELVVAFEGSADNLPILTGPPGIGKSSLFGMLEQILQGDAQALVQEGLAHLMPESLNRLIVWVKCSGRIEDEAALAHELAKAINRQLRTFHSSRMGLGQLELSATAGIVGVKATWEKSESMPEQDPLELLLQRLDVVFTDSPIDQVVFLLDECEQLPWLDRLLDFTREFSPPSVRFCLAMRDLAAHRLASATQGDYRWPKRIKVGSLSSEHIRAIFDSATAQLAELEIFWNVSDDALAYITHHSAGEPWYCHLIGEQLVLGPASVIDGGWQLGERKAAAVRREEVISAERKMIESRLISLNSERYAALTRRAPSREELLRCLAKYPQTHIPHDYLTFLRQRRGKHFLSNLTILSEGVNSVLAREPGSLAWRFSEHQFRVYCRIAQPMYEGADALAETSLEAWSRHPARLY